VFGFANGDPVNFSDPFGLCVPWPACAFAAGRAGSAIGTVVGAGVGAIGGVGVGIVPGAIVGNRIGWVAGAGAATLGAAALAADHAPAQMGRISRALGKWAIVVGGTIGGMFPGATDITTPDVTGMGTGQSTTEILPQGRGGRKKDEEERPRGKNH
jgi:hypothetical protein